MGLTGGTVNANESHGDPGATSSEGSDGGLYITKGSGTATTALTITGSQINGNTAVANTVLSSGGGLYLSSTTATINNATVGTNTGGAGAGAYVASSVTRSLTDSTLSGNTGMLGGGLDNLGTLNILRSTVSGNMATCNNGQIAGGILNSGTFRAMNSTFSNNTASGTNGALGGAIWSNGTATLTTNTITNNNSTVGNSASGVYCNGGTPSLTNNIVAGNVNNGSHPDVMFGFANGFSSGGYNLIGYAGNMGVFTQTGDQRGTSSSPRNPQLAALASNGGPTQTHQPLTGSPVIDKGVASLDPITNATLTTDQHGVTRPSDDPAIANATGGDGSKIGAFEVDVPVTLTVTNTADSGAGSLRDVLDTAGSDNHPNFIVFNIPASDPGNVNGVCTITLASSLAPGADSGKLLTIDGATGGNAVTLDGNGATQILNVVGGAALSVDSLNFTRGNASTGGAAFVSQYGSLTSTNCALHANSAANGGAIYTENGSAPTLTNDTVSGNSASQFGGGIYTSGATTVTNCTISGNSAQFEGGVVLFSSGTCAMSNTIVAGNTASFSPDLNGTFTSQGYNLIGNATGASGFTATNDQTDVDFLLSPLTNNGGKTRTHALKVGSPAIDAGNSTLTRDQRGLARPYDYPNVASATGGNGADIGAYEARPVSIANPSFEVDISTVKPGYARDNGGIIGWTYTGGAGLNGTMGAMFFGDFANIGTPPDGDQVAFLNGPSSLSTTITDLTPGTAYTLGFRCNSKFSGNGSEPPPVTTVSVNGVTQTFNTCPSQGGGTESYYSAGINFTATGSAAPLVVSNLTVQNAPALVDDFTIAPTVATTPTAPVLFTSDSPSSQATVGTPYASFGFTATGTQPITYAITAGALPPGLTLTSYSVLSGTPTSAGTGTFPNVTVTASNGVGPNSKRTFSISVRTIAANYLASFGLTGTAAALGADPNGDGVTNLMAYALGLNPTVQSANALPKAATKNHSGVPYVYLTFNHSSVAMDLTYTAEASSDLANWTTVASSTAGATTTGTGFVNETGSAPTFLVEVRDTQAVNTTNGAGHFLRLRVTSS